ncbi:MAG: cyclic pyranopterin monophosphate synthase MoaC [Planctomycetaceae bacterium]|nr:cyclic pyranopterin monophosphate synthase MoaC [Planctomycetaceae bacterium]
MNSDKSLTHFDEHGASRMVDVGEKATTSRVAIAEGFVQMQSATLQKITANDFKKGNVFEVARLAGIMATKRTSDLIPLCHLLPLESTQVEIESAGTDRVRIVAKVSVHAKTGIEMEALTAVSVAALTIYDMCKAVDRSMVIGPISLLEKSGGRSGHYQRE